MTINRAGVALRSLVSMCLLACYPATVLAGASACAGLYPGGTVPFNGLNPALEGKPPLSRFRSGQIVEIDTGDGSHASTRRYISQLQDKGVRVSVYLVGGHCYVGDDCQQLQRGGVRTGSTGSWHWNNEEQRVLDITKPASMQRLLREARLGWSLGANYVRIDNLHHPAGSQNPRTIGQMKTIFDAIQDLENDLHADGTIPADRPTGIVAHNNLETWEKLILAGHLQRPPVFLTSERTAQLAFKGEGYKGDRMMKQGRLHPRDVGEIAAGGRISTALGIPYTIAEFKISHDLGGRRGTTYQLPDSYVQALRRMPGVSDIIIIPHESEYVGRGQAYRGDGPRELAARSHPAGANKIAQACLAGSTAARNTPRRSQ